MNEQAPVVGRSRTRGCSRVFRAPLQRAVERRLAERLHRLKLDAERRAAAAGAGHEFG